VCPLTGHHQSYRTALQWYEYTHRLSINRPTKRGKEKSPFDGHCQCQKGMDDHLLACQQFLTENHIVTRLANEQALFLNINDIMTFHYLERLTAIIVDL
jgi:hypothetical protein